MRIRETGNKISVNFGADMSILKPFRIDLGHYNFFLSFLPSLLPSLLYSQISVDEAFTQELFSTTK